MSLGDLVMVARTRLAHNGLFSVIDRKSEIAAQGRITYIVGPDGNLYAVDANGHWCDEPDNEPSQSGGP
jgi:hypothetical protein